MTPDDMDRILSCEAQIAPSSGFTAAVMDAVRREAATPPPIPFPWKRALPGMAAAALAIVVVSIASVALFMHGGAGRLPPAALPPALGSLLDGAKTIGAGWILLGLILSRVLVQLSFKLARGKV